MTDIVSVFGLTLRHDIYQASEIIGCLQHPTPVPAEGLPIYKQRLTLTCVEFRKMLLPERKGLRREQCPIGLCKCPFVIWRLRVTSIPPFTAEVLDTPPSHDIVYIGIMPCDHQGGFPNNVSGTGVDRTNRSPRISNLTDPLRAGFGFSNGTSNALGFLQRTFYTSYIGK